MISKTKALEVITAALTAWPLGPVAALLAWPFPTHASDSYRCLRDLMPFTTHGTLRVQRKGVEQPFLAANYIVFPEVANGVVTGFYVYGPNKAYFYDAVAIGGARLPIKSLGPDHGILDLTAQPNGLETVSIPFLPGFNPRESDKEGASVLGSTVLPVVGAVFSRPARARAAYNSPVEARENELRTFISRHGERRMPASELSLERTIIKMIPGERANLSRPLEAELALRRRWVQNHNLDESTFRELTRAMQNSCRE